MTMRMMMMTVMMAMEMQPSCKRSVGHWPKIMICHTGEEGDMESAARSKLLIYVPFSNDFGNVKCKNFDICHMGVEGEFGYINILKFNFIPFLKTILHFSNVDLCYIDAGDG